ncbi:hypothetical protein M405DRAFT_120713 [Rhizopogon salebrosus TDB-379]|nr:hypothetical protein M405DRAFT_120713 [Rhizopogon salebrosus TDB-379]
MIEGCDMQGNLVFKVFSLRGLGEIAFVHGDYSLAAQRFAETKSLCAHMGVPPWNLYSCFLFSNLPERFEGWVMFWRVCHHFLRFGSFTVLVTRWAVA